MITRNKDEYNKYVDSNPKGGMGFEIIKYGINWSELMESEIQKGKLIKEIADDTSKDMLKYFPGFTDNMFNYSMIFILNCWKFEYALELKEWFLNEYKYDYDHLVNALNKDLFF